MMERERCSRRADIETCFEEVLLGAGWLFGLSFVGRILGASWRCLVLVAVDCEIAMLKSSVIDGIFVAFLSSCSEQFIYL